MSDIQEEIKQILKDMDLVANKNKVPIYYSQNDIKIVLDYITNLQEENKKLKELCDKYEEEHNTTFEEWKKDINIIDELEKEMNRSDLSYIETQHVLDKLNELKGDDK